ncbi:MAG: RDD family protein [Bryobacteraceae bacterium]|jgi:uncharacterized RDD family membrane protein YckC
MRVYHAKETVRMQELEGIPLADFWPRAGAFATDVFLAGIAVAVMLVVWGLARWAIETGADVHQHRNYQISLEHEWAKILFEIVVPVLYFGLATFIWNGRTPGKRLFRIRVISLVHEHMSLWHSIERALGYGAAALEFGFGFLQFFIHPQRRTAQDRLAETIVVQESGYRARFGIH